jgi:hypothetical protein
MFSRLEINHCRIASQTDKINRQLADIKDKLFHSTDCRNSTIVIVFISFLSQKNIKIISYFPQTVRLQIHV